MITSKVTYLSPSGRISGRLSRGIGRLRRVEGPRNHKRDEVEEEVPLSPPPPLPPPPPVPPPPQRMSERKVTQMVMKVQATVALSCLHPSLDPWVYLEVSSRTPQLYRTLYASLSLLSKAMISSLYRPPLFNHLQLKRVNQLAHIIHLNRCKINKTYLENKIMSNYPCIASSVLSVTAQSPNELVTIPDSFRLAHYL